MSETISEMITRRVDEMQDQHVPGVGSFGPHAFGNVIGSLKLKHASGKITDEEFHEAIRVFNEIVPGGKVEWRENKDGGTVPYWVENEHV